MLKNLRKNDFVKLYYYDKERPLGNVKVRVGLTPPLAREERVEQVCHIWSRVFTTPRGQNRLMGIKLNPRWIGGSFLSLSLSFFLAQFSSRLMPTGITCICHHFGRKLRSVDELEKSCVAAVHRKTVKCSGQNWRALLHPWLSTRLDVRCNRIN